MKKFLPLVSVYFSGIVFLITLIFCTGCNFKGEKTLSFTGTIEATVTNLSSKATAHVVWVAQEGAKVKKGQIVAMLRKKDYEISVDKAKSGKNYFIARTSQAQAAYEMQVRLSSENVKKAKEGVTVAFQKFSETKIYIQQAQKDYKRWKELFEKGAVARKDLENYENAYEIAKTNFNSAKANLAGAEATLREAFAFLKQDIIRQKDIQACQSLELQAESDIDMAEENLAQTKIVAPFDGWVDKKILQIGELAMPGLPVVTMVDLSDIWIEVFVPEDEIGKIKLGDTADITVDSFPGEKFSGEVVFISSQAEFTPKSVQTKKERVTLVYRIKVKIKNPEQKLKPGTPADVDIF